MSKAETEPLAPDPEFPRYSTRPFPPYRYVYSLNPHPRLDVDGHSYGDPEPWAQHEVGMLLSGEWPTCEQYLYGVDLYNHAYWWEAHEALEAVWIHTESDSPLRHLLQCIIQVSAAHFQRHAGITGGVTRLLQRAAVHREQAANLQPELVGIDFADWWRSRVKPYFANPQQTNPQHDFPFLSLTSRSGSEDI